MLRIHSIHVYITTAQHLTHPLGQCKQFKSLAVQSLVHGGPFELLVLVANHGVVPSGSSHRDTFLDVVCRGVGEDESEGKSLSDESAAIGTPSDAACPAYGFAPQVVVKYRSGWEP